MTEENFSENVAETTGEEMPDELTLLKQTAATMGISHHPNIGLDKLKTKIEEAKADVVVDPSASMAAPGSKKMDPKRAEALKLVRIRISDMNPINANLKGALFSVGNSKLGMVKKFVPFNAEDGFHVPAIILSQIKAKKFVSHFEVKINGKQVNRHKLIPQYAVEILPPLTEKELEELKQRQLMASGA